MAIMLFNGLFRSIVWPLSLPLPSPLHLTPTFHFWLSPGSICAASQGFCSPGGAEAEVGCRCSCCAMTAAACESLWCCASMAASFSCSFVGPSWPEPQLSLPMSSEVLRLEPPTWLDAGLTSVSAKLRARSRALQARFSGGGGARGRSCAACTNRYTVHVRLAAGFQHPTVSMPRKLSLSFMDSSALISICVWSEIHLLSLFTAEHVLHVPR